MVLKDNYYTVSEAAEALGITRQTIYRYLNSRQINAEKIGRETLIEKTEIARFKENRFEDWIYQMVSWNIARNNYEVIREHIGYTENDKIEIIGSPRALKYLVTRENGEKEQIVVKSFSISLDKKTYHLVCNINPADIIRTPIK